MPSGAVVAVRQHAAPATPARSVQRRRVIDRRHDSPREGIRTVERLVTSGDATRAPTVIPSHPETRVGSFRGTVGGAIPSRRHSVPARRVTSARSSANATTDVRSSAERTESGGSRSDESTVRVPGPRGKTNRPVGSVPEPPPPPPPRASRTSGAAPSNHRAPHAVASSARAPVRASVSARRERVAGRIRTRARGVDRPASAAAKDRRRLDRRPPRAAAARATRETRRRDGRRRRRPRWRARTRRRRRVSPSTPRGVPPPPPSVPRAELPRSRTLLGLARARSASSAERRARPPPRGGRFAPPRGPANPAAPPAAFSASTTIPSPRASCARRSRSKGGRGGRRMKKRKRRSPRKRQSPLALVGVRRGSLARGARVARSSARRAERPRRRRPTAFAARPPALRPPRRLRPRRLFRLFRLFRLSSPRRRLRRAPSPRETRLVSRRIESLERAPTCSRRAGRPRATLTSSIPSAPRRRRPRELRPLERRARERPLLSRHHRDERPARLRLLRQSRLGDV